MNRVFVYGTLKKGQRNNHFLHQAEFVGNFTTQNIYSMYEFEGEVYCVTDHLFRMLDDL